MSVEARFHAWLLAAPRTRFEQADLLRGFAVACPEFAGTGEQRARLLESLEQLEKQGHVCLPKSKRGWDGLGNPKLPRFALVVREKRMRQDFSHLAWVPELAELAATAKREDQMATLAGLNAYLIAHRGQLTQLVPYRERALAIFGDEKYFDGGMVRGDALYGRIPLAVIGAMNPDPPLPREDFDVPGRPLLLVENHHTYWSLVHWNNSARQYTAIAYVSGNTYSQAGGALAEAMKRAGAKAAEHFGDIDPEGLRIGATMSAEVQKHGMPALRPASIMYQWLLDHGRRRAFAAGARTPSAAALAWLGPALEAQARHLFAAEQWIPQESLGLEQLCQLNP